MTRYRSTLLGLALLLALPAVAQYSQRGPAGGPAGPNVVPEGTTFIARLDDTLDANRLEVGKHFSAKLMEDLSAPDGSIIPRGTKLKGHVSEVYRGMHGRLLLSFDEIDTRHGKMPLVATVVGVPSEHGLKEVGSEGEIERRGIDKQRTVEAVAVGAAVGAVAGAAEGGGKGAAIGAAAGGSAGFLGGVLTDRDLKLQKGTNLELRLDRGLQVPRG